MPKAQLGNCMSIYLQAQVSSEWVSTGVKYPVVMPFKSEEQLLYCFCYYGNCVHHKKLKQKKLRNYMFLLYNKDSHIHTVHHRVEGEFSTSLTLPVLHVTYFFLVWCGKRLNMLITITSHFVIDTFVWISCVTRLKPDEDGEENFY